MAGWQWAVKDEDYGEEDNDETNCCCFDRAGCDDGVHSGLCGDSPAKTTKINAHFATVEEGEELMRNRKLYHEQINEKNLAFLLQKKGGTLEEFIDYAAE